MKHNRSNIKLEKLSRDTLGDDETPKKIIMSNKFASAEKSKSGLGDKLSPPNNKKAMFSSLSPIKGNNGGSTVEEAAI